MSYLGYMFKLKCRYPKEIKIVLLLFSFALPITAQLKQTNNAVFYSVSPYYGKFQVHTKSLYPYNGTNPWGVELELSQLLLSDKVREQFGTFVKWGVGVNYLNFDHSDLGFAISSIAYIEPFIDARGKWRFSIKAGAGMAYMSNPYDANTNPQNLTYSTNLAFPLYGGGSVYYFIN